MQTVINILSSKGDTKIIFDPKNDDEVEAAEEQFDNLIDKGWMAFEVKKSGEKGKKISKFNPKAGRIIMVPALAGG